MRCYQLHPYWLVLLCISITSFASAKSSLIDITAVIGPDLVTFNSAHGLGSSHRTLSESIKKGDPFNGSQLKLSVHTGTHVDAPSHFLQEAMDAGHNIDAIPLDALVGPAYVVEVPAGSNITAKVLQGLHLPEAVKRLILKTENTARGLMHKKPFDPTYIALTSDGASWLGDHPSIDAVGIDYLSIARFAELAEAHRMLFSKGVIAVEGLVLDEVDPGWYTLVCAPIKLLGSDGAPARCFLMPNEGGGKGSPAKFGDDSCPGKL